MMNQENTQAQTTINSTLTESVKSMASAVQELVELIKNEIAAEATSTTTETTATTTTDAEATETTTVGYLPCPPDAKTAEAATATATTETTTADAEFKGSMIEEEPMDPIPTYEENAAEANADTAEENADKYLDNILCDISTLYDIAEYTLCNEGCNVSTDNSPYAPGENKFGYIDNYKVYISKEIIKAETITGEFRMIVSEKNSGVKILDHSLKIIDNTIKVFSSENTVRIEKLKESKKLMRFMELVDEVSALVMSKYISD